jgi:hypothetical protein
MIGGVEGSKTALLDMFWAPLSLGSAAFLLFIRQFLNGFLGSWPRIHREFIAAC